MRIMSDQLGMDEAFRGRRLCQCQEGGVMGRVWMFCKRCERVQFADFKPRFAKCNACYAKIGARDVHEVVQSE